MNGFIRRYSAVPLAIAIFSILSAVACSAQVSDAVPKAFIDGDGPGWVTLVEDDFADVNGYPETWTWREGLLICSGEPIGVMRTRRTYLNFELVVEWRHLKPGGNSGVFAWVPMDALEKLEPGVLPKKGIEIQMLDHDFRRQYEETSGEKGDWFTTNGDIFAVGTSKLKPFPPTSPNGSRSFPRKQLSRGVGEWNHYYVRCINGEVRLWVNGEEVSGGSGAEPREGHLCFESEGSSIEFRNIRLRELP